MLDMSWISTSLTAVIMAALTAVGIYIALILCTRMMGLRSFSKLSSFDFAITVSIGSVIASVVISDDPPLLLGAVVLAMLYLLQFTVGWLRTRSTRLSRLVDNQPLLLMDGETILEENLKAAKMTRADLIAKLRESNVTRFSQVYAVVFESTGDVSVLHSGADDGEFDQELLSGVTSGHRDTDC